MFGLEGLEGETQEGLRLAARGFGTWRLVRRKTDKADRPHGMSIWLACLKLEPVCVRTGVVAHGSFGEKQSYLSWRIPHIECVTAFYFFHLRSLVASV
jgi:hypothetical protein